MPVVVVRQRKAWRRKDGVFLYFEVCASSCSTACLQTRTPAGQRRRYRQQQRGHERLSHRRPGRKRMRKHLSILSC